MDLIASTLLKSPAMSTVAGCDSLGSSWICKSSCAGFSQRHLTNKDVAVDRSGMTSRFFINSGSSLAL